MARQHRSTNLQFFLALSTVAAILWFDPGPLRAQSTALDCTGDFLPPDERPRFFPVEADEFGPNGDETIRWYACLLRAMQETPLVGMGQETGAGAFRLLVIPVFRPAFVVRLIVTPAGFGQLAVKAGEGWKNAGNLTLNCREQVSREGVDKFLRLLDEANFWSEQTNQFYTEEQVIASRNSRSKRRRAVQAVVGGVQWVLEGAQGGQYHVVGRTSPEPGPYANLTSYLFRDLAKLELPNYREPPHRKGL